MTMRGDMEAIVEAILFVSNDPVSRERLLEVFDPKERDAAAEALQAVVERYRERPESGLVVDEVAGGLRLMSRPDLHGYLRRFFEVSGTNKLSMPALETLAIVAYRQPVTAPEINELRGVSSQGVLKTLLERRMVRVAGRKEVVGKPFLYATTREFLMHFGLRSLKELPPLEQFEELFGGDPEADAERPRDLDEVADREAAEIEEDREAERLRAEAEADARQKEESEAAELGLDAVEPAAEEDSGTVEAPEGEAPQEDSAAQEGSAEKEGSNEGEGSAERESPQPEGEGREYES